MALHSEDTDSSSCDLAQRRRMTVFRVGVGVALAVSFLLPHAPKIGVWAVVVPLFVGVEGLRHFLRTKMAAKERTDRETVADETIEEILDHLGDEQLVLNNVGCQFGKIDHIVLSKNYGVFLIETDMHGGRVAIIDSKIRVNGKLPEKDFIAQTLRNTYWVIEELEMITGQKPSVTSLVVFTNAFIEKSWPIKEITVTNNRHLLESMRQLGKPLEPQIWAAREKIAGLFAGTAAGAPKDSLSF